MREKSEISSLWHRFQGYVNEMSKKDAVSSLAGSSQYSFHLQEVKWIFHLGVSQVINSLASYWRKWSVPTSPFGMHWKVMRRIFFTCYDAFQIQNPCFRTRGRWSAEFVGFPARSVFIFGWLGVRLILSKYRVWRIHWSPRLTSFILQFNVCFEN
jgi:hypothetical protein